MAYLLFIVLVVGYVALRWRRSEDVKGEPLPTGMIGLQGTAKETFAVEGTIMVRGEIWRATSRDGIIQRGDLVTVTAMEEGLLLEVQRVEPKS